MGLKLIILIVAILFLTINGLTRGLLLNFIMPNSEEILGNICCLVGGMILNPQVMVGSFMIPIPMGDDVLVVSVLTGIVTLLFLRKIKSKKKFFVGVALTFAILMVLEKITGYILVGIAASRYGMENCVSQINLGPITLEHSWYQPLYAVGIFFGVIAIVGIILKVKKMRQGN